MRRVFAAVLACVASGLARADAQVLICYNYACLAEAQVSYAREQLRELREMLRPALNAEQERAVLAQVMGRLYAWAGEQTPVWRDRAGDYLDEYGDGRMDCIDHALSSSRLLDMLEQARLLRFHRPVGVARRMRFGVAQHFSALVEESGSGVEYVVDSWFVDNGQPAVVMPLELWLNGGGPDV